MMSSNIRGRLSNLGNTTPLMRRLYFLMGTITLPTVWIIISEFHLINELYFPSPWRVFTAAFDIKPNLIDQSVSTVGLSICGYMTGLLLAFFFGLLQRLFAFARFSLSVIFETMRPVPPVALIPFFIIWFGYSWYGKWILISIGIFLLLYPAIVNSIDQLNPIYYRLARTLGATDGEFLRHAAVPAMIPGLLGQLRVGLSFSLALAVISEYMGADIGIGRIINIALNTFSTHTVVLCTILLGLIGYFLDALLRLSHAYMATWSSRVEEAIR